MTPHTITWNFQNFTCVFTILVKFDIYFLGLPWEIVFVHWKLKLPSFLMDSILRWLTDQSNLSHLKFNLHAVVSRSCFELTSWINYWQTNYSFYSKTLKLILKSNSCNTNWIIAAWLAQLDNHKRRSAEREVAGSNPGPDQHSGS